MIGSWADFSTSFVFSILAFYLCFINEVRCEEWNSNLSRIQRGVSDLRRFQSQHPPASLGKCDFEHICDWTWRGDRFKKVQAPTENILGLVADANQDTAGHFLLLIGHGESHIKSKAIPRTGSECYLELALHQVEMMSGAIRLVIETNNNTTWVAAERSGNNNAKWEATRFNLGVISQPYRLVLEVVAPFENSSIAVDNIRLVNCFPESRILHENCSDAVFRCNNGSCLNKTRLCDLTPDCADGEDETRECEKIRDFAMCNFEHGWCGWTNELHRPLNWTLHRGPAPSDRTGPSYDHTYRNETGTYAYMGVSKQAKYGNRGTINSPIYNPPPPYSNDPSSKYYDSCKIRFFYHQFGIHVGSLALHLVQLQPHHNQTKRLWWSYGDKSDVWYNQEVTLNDIRYKYFLQFEASRGLTSKGDVAIDDISLSRECFGIGVPPEVLGDYDYHNQKIPSLGYIPPKHMDFVNETVVQIGTCGQTGRHGPTPEQCASHYNGTEIEVLFEASANNGDSNFRFKGIQRWTAPRGGYYTLIGLGAGGGRGSLLTGSTLGAMTRGVVELEKGQELYFMIGQPGRDACPKSLDLMLDSCQQPSQNISNSTYGSTIVREVKKIKLKDGGGGGGGATYIFTLKSNGEQQPLLIAAGGGGLGLGQFVDNGVQHAKGAPSWGRRATSGSSSDQNGGAGGGWDSLFYNSSDKAGMILIKGGTGGIGCGTNNRGHGDGGFGGGGGGCLSGGGGGGFIGGSTSNVGNGEGGYSYASPDLLNASFQVKANAGPGEAYIIPAISGCGCDFRCVVIDQHLSETRCLCPTGWKLGNDSRSCMVDESDSDHQTFTILLIIVSVGLVFAFSGLCFLLYNRYQQKKASLRRRQVIFGNGTELTVLRVVPDHMMTEFNPNYEFAGNLHSFKDLPQIPRENIKLGKALGQGAFGEVYQGIYEYSRNGKHPVAVKTLPLTSSSQAEADFMMEALIMSKFSHPNIVHFIGVSFDKHPRYIVLELLAGGDLKNFLREERPRSDRPTTLSMHNLVMCAYNVAEGCKYMEDARFIHRDIAARNCLLTCKGPGRVVKIADFGMARDIYRSDYYRKGGKAMLPIKWMPPESFLDGIFTTKTDVWAFGVLLWEIMSFGYMPYTGCANREVMTMVTTGGRLERPAGCPDPVYGIMTRCWHPNPEDRPSFTTIVERIGYCLQDPDVLNHPMPNYDNLPICEREITIMRPDPETECINVHSDLDGCGYMQPLTNFHQSSYRIGPAPGVVYAALRHSEDREHENMQERHRDQFHHDDYLNSANNMDDEMNQNHLKAERTGLQEQNANKPVDKEMELSKIIVDNSRDAFKLAIGSENGNEESTTTTDTNSDSLFIPSSGTPPDTSSSSPNTRTSSPNHAIMNANGNLNGIIKKSALKAALSLDPGALCRGTVPYEKIAFSSPSPRVNNSDSSDLKDPMSHELPRAEECSC